MKISQNLEEGSLKIENGVNRIKIECGWYKLFISTQHKDEEEKLIERFKLGMNRSFQMFEQHTFRKSHGLNRKSSINKSLFEIWGVIFAKMSQENFEKLMKNKNQFLIDYSKIITDYEFQILISRDSMKSASVKLRFEKCNQLVNNFVL